MAEHIQLIPNGYGHDFPELGRFEGGAIGIPGICSLFQTIMTGARAWFYDSTEQKINFSIQLFGAPFSMMSTFFNGIMRIIYIAGILGLHAGAAAIYFVPMAITGVVMAVCELAYQCHTLFYQVQFMRRFYENKNGPEAFFAFLFDAYLGVTNEERARIVEQIQREHRDQAVPGRVIVEQRDAILLAKMLPLTRRIGWLAREIVLELHAHPDGVKREQVREWMHLIEVQMTKKLVLHILAIATILVLGVGLALALAGAPAAIPLVLLSISPLLTAATYLFSAGVMDSRGWTFSFVACIPEWLRRPCGIHFTPGQRGVAQPA